MGLRILAILLLCGSTFAAEAKISGPNTAKTGDLVVISAKESTGKAFKWIMPSNIQTLSCSDLEFGFASGTPGVYTFTLIAADTESDGNQIAVASHTVRVGDAVEPAPEPEPEQPPPDEPTPGLFEALRKLSQESAARLNDKQTATGLAETIRAKADEIERMCEAGQCPTLAGAKRMMVVAIENRLLTLKRDQSVAWAKVWREPVNAKLQESDTSTVANYLAAMRAAALGLSQS
jgi:hypothetical protein